MKRLVLLSALLAGCAAPAKPPPATPVPVSKPALTVTAPASRAPLFIEVVTISQKWVQKFVPTAPADLQAWSDAPKESFQHILIKGSEPASKKKAQALLDRAKKGEDFAKLAMENTEDPGSKTTGGEYDAKMVDTFVDPVKTAFQKLKVGELSPALVESSFGFHVLKKSKPSEELVARLYKVAKAPEVTKKLALDLTGRIHGSITMRAAISESVVLVLGEIANADEKRPKAVVIEREQLPQTRLPPAAKAGLVRFADGAHSGDVLDDPAPDGQDLFVARAASEAG